MVKYVVPCWESSRGKRHYGPALHLYDPGTYWRVRFVQVGPLRRLWIWLRYRH